MKKQAFLAAALLLTGCGDESAKKEVIFKVATQDALVLQTMPAIRHACPGLDRYAADFQAVRVEEQFRTTIAFDVPERNGVPEHYKASGHSCFVEIEKDGSAIFIEKKACKSLCLDRLDVPDGQLKLSLASVK